MKRGKLVIPEKFNTTLNKVFPQGHFVRNVIVLAGGTAFAQAITILVSPILTRLYTPGDYGVVAVYSSTLGILTTVASLRYELAIPLPEKDEDAVNLVILSLIIVALMSILVGLVALVFGVKFIQWIKIQTLRPYLWLFPISMFLIGSYQVFNFWAVRKEGYDIIAKTKLYQGLGSAITQITLGILKCGPLGLISGQIVGQSAGISTLSQSLLKKHKEKLTPIRLNTIKKVASRYQRFPKYSSIGGLVNTAGLQIPSILFAYYYGPQVAGWYALAQRVLGLPMNLVGQAVSQVYIGTASKLVHNDLAAFRSLFLKAAKRLSLIGGIVIFILALFGPWIFALIFGPNWENAGRYIQILSPAILLQFVVAPLSQTMNILEHQHWQLSWDIFRLILIFLSIFVTYSLGGTPWFAMLAYSLSMTFAYIVLFMMNLFLIKKH
jgi:O-antigen/teichoic acid export membrane protein